MDKTKSDTAILIEIAKGNFDALAALMAEMRAAVVASREATMNRDFNFINNVLMHPSPLTQEDVEFLREQLAAPASKKYIADIITTARVLAIQASGDQEAWQLFIKPAAEIVAALQAQ